MDAEPRDHPRVCGEKPGKGGEVAEFKGSPPRVRGKGLHRGNKVVVFGITPACAGKSSKSGKSDMTEKDHPRVCGEKSQW